MSRTPKHTCPAIGCKVRIRIDYAFCPAHWRLLPGIIQGRIWANWNAMRWLEHKRAMKDAIEFLAKEALSKS